jgi:hypothetical protein
MSRLDDLERKRADAMYELENALDERDKAKALADKPPLPTAASGEYITIGARQIVESDTQGILRLWTEELRGARSRLRSLDGEIARAQRSK